MKKHFGLYNLNHGDTLCIIEMDDKLLEKDGYIIDHETMTLKPINNGEMWTLVPITDQSVPRIMNIIKSAYTRIAKEPTTSIGGLSAKLDSLVEAVGLLFGTIEYFVVEEPQDMIYIINPAKVPDGHEMKKTVIKVIDQINGMQESSEPNPSV